MGYSCGTVGVEKCNKYYIFWVCFCSLRYLACNTHASCCHLRPVRLYKIFPHYLKHGTIFGKTLLNIKHVLIFLNPLCETLLILRRLQWGIMNVNRSSCTVPVILVRSLSTLICHIIFSKNININQSYDTYHPGRKEDALQRDGSPPLTRRRSEKPAHLRNL